MCFVWIWKQTAIISLYSINWLVFITEEWVYCAVRAQYFNITHINLILLGRVIALAVSCPFLTAEVQVRFQASPWYVVNEFGLGQACLRMLQFSAVSNIPQMLHKLIFILYSTLLRRTSGQSLGNLSKSNVVSKNGDHWIIEYFNPLKPELNPICYLLALLGTHHFLHVSSIRVKLLTLRRLMSYIYGAPIFDVSRSHTTTQHSR